jgi:hypothetical protein
MEKLKPLLSNLKAQGFWIFCGVALIACVTVYFMTNGKLDAEAKQASAKISTAITTAKSLATAGVSVDPNAEEGQGQKAHPNDTTIAEMKKVVIASAEATRQAWKQKYELQSKFQVFDKATIDEPRVNFRKFLPAEKNAFTDSEEGLLEENVRTNYRDKIRKELPKLAALTRSVWKPNYDKKERKPEEVVIWSETNQELWDSRFTNFASEWNFQAADSGSNMPKTLQVLYTTEDLWLLRSILKDVIAKTVFDKGDIFANDLSVIKQIDHILIGKVAQPSQEGQAGQGGGAMMGSGGSGSSSMMGMSSMGGGNGAAKKGAKQDDSLDPITGRYVDNQGNDIPAKDYRALYGKKGPVDNKKTHWKIAKRVKVRIGLQMDSREIQSFLANCANATFPIQVVSLRVNKHTASKLKGAGSKGGSQSGSGMSSGQGMSNDAEDRAGDLAAGGGSGAGTAPGAGSGMSGGKSGMRSGNQTMAEDDEGYTQPVEIYGYIYIYNKVDNTMFNILEEKPTNP